MKNKLSNILLSDKDKSFATYALLDPCGSSEVYDKALLYEERFSPLYDEEELETVSPYVVEMLSDDGITQWVFSHFKHADWISFIQSSKPYDKLLDTLKMFTKTYDEENGHDVYIRYHDPRATEIVLEMFGKEGREEWFEVIDAIYTRDTLNENRWLKFTYKGKEIMLLSEEEKI